MHMKPWRSTGPIFIACAIVTATAICRMEARPVPPGMASRVAIDGDDIGGEVTSKNGPEAGVWVIAETPDLGAKFRKIVVTNDRGQYLLPDLPKGNYKVWVRGYGLVDSQPVDAAPGQPADLVAVVAPTAQAAAQFYPASYWVSLLDVPPKSAFPMTIPGSPSIATQADWLYSVKNCWGCHELGNKPTREIPESLGTFKTTAQAWERFISSGQLGPHMTRMVNSLGHEQGLKMFADWIDRINQGELPSAPPRPQGIERNVVVTVWDWAERAAFLHAVVSTDRRNPSVNAGGPVYGDDWFAGTLAAVDPVRNETSTIHIPLPHEEDRRLLNSWAPRTQSAPSIYFGDELIWNAPLNPGSLAMDGEGRVWFNVQNRYDLPAFCKRGSNNSYAKYSPRESAGKGVDVYDPRTRKFEFVDLCVTAERLVFSRADDKRQTLYLAAKEGGLAWIDTRVWDETHDSEKSQGWCPAVIDVNRDGKAVAYTSEPEPLDPKLDRAVPSPGGDGVAYNPTDDSVWYSALNPRPGRLIRMVRGANPPATCNAEVYEVPYDPRGSGSGGSHPRGIDIDTNGVVWAPLAGEGILASFDRRRCKLLTGEGAEIGRHCAEGWAFYPIPGPGFKTQPEVKADFPYSMWLDRFGAAGLGKDIPIVDGADSDSLIAFIPKTKKWVRLQVPYPMGFSSHFFDARIDNAKAGWKGRGVWAANETTGSQLTEGGKNMPSQLAHFQIRPDPLGK
jgi:hypothetical protein